MSFRKSSLWCVVKECNKYNNNVMKKRHFFRFPKENERWLKWIHACGRFDLKEMGPEYGHRSHRLCHLHFEKKWYKINKSRARLHPDSVPTIFFGINNTPMTAALENGNIIKKECLKEETNSDVQLLEPIFISVGTNVEIAKSSTSSSMHLSTVIETPREIEKLKERNLKLEKENRMLRERIGQLQRKIERMENARKRKEDPLGASFF